MKKVGSFKERKDVKGPSPDMLRTTFYLLSLRDLLKARRGNLILCNPQKMIFNTI
jgi:hypothetical protein